MNTSSPRPEIFIPEPAHVLSNRPNQIPQGACGDGSPTARAAAAAAGHAVDRDLENRDERSGLAADFAHLAVTYEVMDDELGHVTFSIQPETRPRNGDDEDAQRLEESATAHDICLAEFSELLHAFIHETMADDVRVTARLVSEPCPDLDHPLNYQVVQLCLLQGLTAERALAETQVVVVGPARNQSHDQTQSQNSD